MDSKREGLLLNNLELQDMFNNDQTQRMGAVIVDESMRKNIFLNDQVRKARVVKFLTEGKVVTALDHYHAAMILQHSDKAEDVLIAKELATKSYELGENKARWLAAAAEDRYLMFTNQQQKYGSQFQYDESQHKWKLWPVDPNITDLQRVEMGMPTLQQAEARISQLPSFK